MTKINNSGLTWRTSQGYYGGWSHFFDRWQNGTIVGLVSFVANSSQRPAGAASAWTSTGASRALFKVVRMSTKWLYLITLLLVIGCQQANISAAKPTESVSETTTKAKLSEQLKIYESTLREGTSEQIRIVAATEMLFSEDPLARGILLSVLKEVENSPARMAVCKALSRTRAEQKPVKNKNDFIAPLLEILAAESVTEAKLAAEATLIFDYEQISEPLEKMVTDPSLPVKVKLNAIYALQLQSDKKAVIKLIELVDAPDSQVAAAAEKALYSLGIPLGKDAEARQQIIDEIKSKDTAAFLQDRLIRREAQIRQLKDELSRWEKRYLSALDKVYSGISDDTAMGKFLAEHLASSEAVVRLWALEKVHQARLKPKSKLPAELGPILVELISDQNRDVRLKTAELLSLMVELNSAERLLEQMKVEQDEEVKMALLTALGGTCHYAFSPDSPIKIPPETRKQALEWAATYLSEQVPRKAQKGAEVMRKLLEQDGLTSKDVEKYLGLLMERYEQEKNNINGSLRAGLLSTMAGLCAQGSACKVESAKLFGPFFEQALSDKTDLVRVVAAEGLIHIDKTKALIIFRSSGLEKDNSIEIRKKMINLASEVGGKDDLVWLAKKIGSTGESDIAWQSMLKIFKSSSCDAGVLAEWIGEFDSPNSGLSYEQMIAFFEVAERKAIGENKPQMLKDVRKRLAGLYTKSGNFEQAAKYLGMFYETAGTSEEKDPILAELLDAYLRWPNVGAATKLVDNCLLINDLEPNSAIVRAIDDYLSEPPVGADPKAVLGAILTNVKSGEDRPKWQAQVKIWTNRLGQNEESDEPKKGGS